MPILHDVSPCSVNGLPSPQGPPAFPFPCAEARRNPPSFTKRRRASAGATALEQCIQRETLLAKSIQACLSFSSFLNLVALLYPSIFQPRRQKDRHFTVGMCPTKRRTFQMPFGWC